MDRRLCLDSRRQLRRTVVRVDDPFDVSAEPQAQPEIALHSGQDHCAEPTALLSCRELGLPYDHDPHGVETLGRSGSFVIPTHEQGHPKHRHPKHEVALALVSSDDDHGALEADPRIYPIADLTDLDQLVGELDDAKRAWIDAVTELRRVSREGSVREVLRRLGQQLEPDFDEENYWVQ